MTLSYINTNKFKVSSLSLSIYLPSTPLNSLLGLLLAGVMHRGTQKYPSFSALNRHLSMLYCTDINIHCSKNGSQLCFSLEADMLEQRYVPDKAPLLEGVVDTMAQILLYPKLCEDKIPEDTLSAEKAILRDTLLAEKNSSSAYSMLRLKELMSRDKNIATLEYMLDTLDTISAEALGEFHSMLLSLPIDALYVGGESADALEFALCRALSAQKRVAVSPDVSLTPAGALPFLRTEEDKRVTQSYIAMGFRTGVCINGKDYPTARLLNEILGASPASKLFLDVRERQGLCYSCYSSYAALTGNIYVGSGIDCANAALAEEAILACLDELKNGKICNAELFAAKKSLSFYYTQLSDSPHSISRFYSLRPHIGVNSTPSEELASILERTREQVAEFAQKIQYDTVFLLNGTYASEAKSE